MDLANALLQKCEQIKSAIAEYQTPGLSSVEIANHCLTYLTDLQKEYLEQRFCEDLSFNQIARSNERAKASIIKVIDRALSVAVAAIEGVYYNKSLQTFFDLGFSADITRRLYRAGIKTLDQYVESWIFGKKIKGISGVNLDVKAMLILRGKFPASPAFDSRESLLSLGLKPKQISKLRAHGVDSISCLIEYSADELANIVYHLDRRTIESIQSYLKIQGLQLKSTI